MSLWIPDPDRPSIDQPERRFCWRLIGGPLDGAEFRPITPDAPLYVFARRCDDGIEAVAIHRLARSGEYPGFARYAMRRADSHGAAAFTFSPEQPE